MTVEPIHAVQPTPHPSWILKTYWVNKTWNIPIMQWLFMERITDVQRR